MENQETPAEETPEVSVEDRIANFLAPQAEQPATESEAAPPQETEQETFEFETNGKKYVLPKELEPEVLKAKDYTQKTQTLAEMRKDVERQFAQIKLAQQEAQLAQAVKPEMDQIGMIDAVLEQYKGLKWQDMSTDELVRKKLEMDQYKDMRSALEHQVNVKKAQHQQTFQQELEKLKAEARETLKKRVNWSDETETEVRNYVRELGITDAEYDGVFDPRHKQILWEASQFRKLKASAQPVAQQVKAVKAQSSNPMPQQVKDKLAFNKAIKAAPNPQAKSEMAAARLAKIFEV